MSNKVKVFYPNYQMRPTSYMPRSSEIAFSYGGALLVTRQPFFGATETAKEALQWASHSTPPVICVEHERPTAPDKGGFYDPNDGHRNLVPYAMVTATIKCLGEKQPRKIKIYFCDAHLCENNAYNKVDTRYKMGWVVPLES